MPVPIPPIAALTEVHITKLVIKVKGGGENTRIAEFNAETAAAWIPAELQEKLIKLVDTFIIQITTADATFPAHRLGLRGTI